MVPGAFPQPGGIDCWAVEEMMMLWSNGSGGECGGGTLGCSKN